MRRALLGVVAAVVLTALTAVPGDSAADSASAPRRDDTAAPAVVVPTEVPVSNDPSAPPTSGLPSSQAPTTPPASGVDPCTPAVPLVDPEATPEATCLAAKLDEWQSTGRYGIGQQINTSSVDYDRPIQALAPDRPAVVGFDLAELDLGETYGFATSPLDSLLDLASQGVVLTASWHTPNPATGYDSGDRSFQDLSALLDPTRPEYAKFWADVDSKLELLRRFQTGDDGLYPPAAVMFRPFHEANGDWFWWAQGTDPSTFKALYAAIQQRAADAGIHNIVWGWTPNAKTGDNISDPLSILPDHVDIVGVDSYESVAGGKKQGSTLDLTGLSELAARVPRIAVSEAGPHGSKHGNWDPTVVARTAVAQGLRPSYVMFWFDDGDGSDGYTGKKQIASLRDGFLLLTGCPDGVCPLV